MTAHGDQHEKPLDASRLIKFFALLIFVLWGINLMIPLISVLVPSGYVPRALVKAYSQAQLARTGTFGDTFGAVNSLFSGLAFAGVAVAVMFQRRELRHQEEQTAIAKEQLGMAIQQSKEADEERKRAERYAALTAALNAASSLAQAASQRIQFTLARAQQYTQFAAMPMVGRQATNPADERRLRKYIQMQQLLLYEINRFDDFYAEGRSILSVQTKKDYMGAFVKSAMDDWTRLTFDHHALRRDSQQPPDTPDENWSARHAVRQQASDLLNNVSQEIDAFLSQEGVWETSLYNFLKSNISSFEKVRSEFNLNNEDNEAVHLLFNKVLNTMAKFDVSYVVL